MTRDEAHNGKSCGPQLFADGQPSGEWGLEELSTFAQMQYRQILDGEKLLAPAYWRLGQALALAKKAFKHGKWSQYLKDLGIDKTRASKARAIFQAFEQVENVAQLTVEQAYATRQRKRSAKADEGTNGVAQPRKDVQRLRRSVSSIGKRTEDVIHDAAFAAPEEAMILIPALRKAIRQLQELLGYLEKQAGAGPADATAEKADSAEMTGPAS